MMVIDHYKQKYGLDTNKRTLFTLSLFGSFCYGNYCAGRKQLYIFC